MNLALGMIVYNEQEMLNLFLPKFYQEFQGIVAIDTGSRDNTITTLKRLGADVATIPWINYGDARNHVLARAEELGYDYLFMMDADEGMLLSDCRALYSMSGVVAFPRYEFVVSRDFIDPTPYPDFQVRLIQLHKGYRYAGIYHEILQCSGFSRQPCIHVYHYGRLKPAEQINFHYFNAARMEAGLSRLEEIPSGISKVFTPKAIVPFIGEQPL